MSPRLLLIWRGFAAATLLATYYILGFGIGGGLLYLSYLMRGSHNGYMQGLYLAAMYIGTVIVSFVIPHPIRFQEPGPRVDPDEQPQFFEVVKRAAATARKPIPREIYLVESLDNAVTYRGGFLGIGAKPVMLIGFPLMHMLTVPQFEAMLVYWFMHSATSRPWIDEFLLETRDGVFRVLHTRLLPERSLKFNVFLYPMMGYRLLFYRAYEALMKSQQRLAQELARRLVPPKDLDGAIAVVERHGYAFREYFRDDISVNLRQGYHPPLMDGFRQYQESSGQKVEEPPQAAASSLLKGTHWLESSLMKAQTPNPERPLKWIGWEEAGENSVLAHWDWLVNLNYSALHRLTLESLLETASNIDPFAAKTWGGHEDDETRRWYAEEVLIAAFGCALYRAGWKIDYTPGSWSLSRGDFAITPRKMIAEMRQAPAGAHERWIEVLESLKLDPAMSLVPPQEKQVSSG